MRQAGMSGMTQQQIDDPILERFRDIPTALITDAFLRLGFRGWMDGVLRS